MKSIFDLCDHPDAVFLRRDRETKILMLPDALSGEGDLFVKIYEVRTKIQRFKSMIRRRKSAFRDYKICRRLQARGFEVPEPVGACNRFSSFLSSGRSLFAARWIADAISIRELMERIARQQENSNTCYHIRHNEFQATLTAAGIRCLCYELGRYCRLLHEKGIVSSDLNTGNIMVRCSDNRQFRFLLVDYERIGFCRRVGIKMRLRDLSLLTAGILPILTNTVEEVVRGYLSRGALMERNILAEKLQHHITKLHALWENRENRNFEAIYRNLNQERRETINV